MRGGFTGYFGYFGYSEYVGDQEPETGGQLFQQVRTQKMQSESAVLGNSLMFLEGTNPAT